ncbi:Na/Pi cotransporter family protein [Tropicibacter oceani]|uniref:Na/Pi cotransporter family protein n=1 Tax=Tropicibacter oceani TaxID=3058420 RepID=A0ABY8QDS5_9RHOB|nr:Na/Pi cotransporter family protein [Tropicibacter oceani]WGW02357.1 Na/Pi cotransporter family protein [Tropicibacter oceani]
MISLIVNMAAAVALLLWSVRLIRTGVERAFLSQIRRRLKAMAKRPASAVLGGGVSAMVLQSSTAVALIAGGFAASGLLAPSTGLALMLGADLGSALITQVLVLPVQGITPFLILTGVVLFLNGKRPIVKQSGRIVLGLALVLTSLDMIRNATDPVRGTPFVGSLAAYLEGDLVTAFVLGALFAWAVHSSLAAVLTIAAFAANAALPVPAAMALVVGANLGAGAIPFALMWSAPQPVRQMVTGNLLARGAVSLGFLVALLGGLVPGDLFPVRVEQQIIGLHVAVNVVLLVMAFPAIGLLLRLARRILPVPADPGEQRFSALDPGSLRAPQLALSCGQRELLHMGETIHAMLVPVLGLIREWSDDTAGMIARREDDVDRMHFEIKIYLARLKDSQMTEDQIRQATDIVAMANSLEDAGDRISTTLVGIADRLHKEGLGFSDTAWADLEEFHDHVVTNTQLALNVLMSGDVEAARQLVAEKDSIREEEQRLQVRHLARLRDQDMASVETTNIHQEVLRVLKQINAALTYVAYPIAEETGDLLATRLAKPGFGTGRR